MAIESGVRWNGSPKTSDPMPNSGESRLKAKEDQLVAREAAMADYASARHAVEENMARLRALRLERDSTRAISAARAAKVCTAKKAKRRSASRPTVANDS
jgi:hypothetical protein